MRTHALRALALLAALTIAIGSIDVVAAPAASAEPSSENVEFTFAAFPHATSAVNFWDSWGSRRSGGRRHRGIDIMSPRGTEIVAVADGVVTAFGKQRLSGYFIRIDHGDGYQTTYMHLNNDTIGTDDGEGGLWTAIYPTLSVGSEVHAGQVIGYVGDSGNAEGTRPHTHFELKVDGAKVNPYTLLEEAWKQYQQSTAFSLSPR